MTLKDSSFYVYFDGLCEPKNPGGVATFGFLIQREGVTIFEDGGLAEAKPWSTEASNNVAEYSAVIRALEWLAQAKYQDSQIILRGDSKLIINQLNGKFKVKSLRLIDLHCRAKELISQFKNLQIEWIDRSQNQEADRLSRMAYRKYANSHPEQL